MSDRSPRAGLLLTGLAAALVLIAGPDSARGAVVLSLSPATINATSGDTGLSFDVLLKNETGVSIDLGTFSFELIASSANITLTLANTSSPNYVFSTTSEANTFYGGVTSIPGPPGPGLTAIDNSLAIAGEPVADNQTVSLGRVFFDVTGPPGTYTIDFTNIGAGTSLADAAGNDIDLTGATITGATVIVSAVPEPSSLTLAATLGVVMAAARLVRRRPRTRHDEAPAASMEEAVSL